MGEGGKSVMPRKKPKSQNRIRRTKGLVRATINRVAMEAENKERVRLTTKGIELLA